MNPKYMLFQIIPPIVCLRTILNNTSIRARGDMKGPNVAYEVRLTIELSSRGAALPSASEDRSRVVLTISCQVHSYRL